MCPAIRFNYTRWVGPKQICTRLVIECATHPLKSARRVHVKQFGSENKNDFPFFFSFDYPNFPSDFPFFGFCFRRLIRQVVGQADKAIKPYSSHAPFNPHTRLSTHTLD